MLTQKRWLALASLSVISGMFPVVDALAQSLPATVDAGRLSQSMEVKELPKGGVATPAETGSAPEVQAPKGSEKIKLKLNKVVIVGASVIPQEKLAAAYSNQVGKQVTLVDVYAIANQVTRIYRENGYILSRAVVPQQQIHDGVVRIEVVEGFISSFNVQSDIESFGGRLELEAFARKFMSKGPVTAQNLERYLLLMNDLPGLQVRSVFSPSKTVPGGADMTLVVERNAFNGMASVDNYGNSYLGPARVTLGTRFNSLFNSSDEIKATALVAPDHGEVNYYNAGFRHNIGNEGTKYGFNATYAETNPTLPPALGGLLDPEGQAFTVSLTLDHPFIRSRNLNVYGGIGFDATKNKTDYGDGLSALETKDDQRIARMNGQVSYLDSLGGFNIGSLGLSKGMELLGSSEKGQSNLSRANGDPSFAKVNFDASRLQRLYGPFTGLLAVSTQYSDSPLLASEQFSFGGNNMGRGYDASEITGDHGVAGKVELAYNKAIQKRYLNDYQIFVFYDMGKVWVREPIAGQAGNDSASSAGIGTRMSFTPAVHGEAFIAKPLTHDVPSRGEDNRDLRFKFSLATSF